CQPVQRPSSRPPPAADLPPPSLHDALPISQVLVGEVREQALHDLVAPPTRAVMLELRVEVAGGLTGDRWEIGFAVRPAGFAVAGGARDETLGHLGIVIALLGRCGRGGSAKGEQDEEGRPVHHGFPRIPSLERRGLSQLGRGLGRTEYRKAGGGPHPARRETGRLTSSWSSGRRPSSPPGTGRSSSTRGEACALPPRCAPRRLVSRSPGRSGT